jgi:hypothetical protein
LNTWANNFSSKINLNPAQYGLSSADGTVISGVVAAFNSALTLTTDPAGKTPASVQAKDTAKISLTICAAVALRSRGRSLGRHRVA